MTESSAATWGTPDDPVKLLWTGGWDSTFRLLELAVLQGRTVQPYYVVSSTRKSVSIERETMDRIRVAIGDRFGPEVAARILPTVEERRADLPEVPEVRAAFESLRNRVRIGEQHRWLATFALKHQLMGLELSVHKFDHGINTLREVFYADLVSVDGRRMLGEELSQPDLWILKFFEFPVIDLSKLDMRRIARRNGLIPIMKLTHFCFDPAADGSACGKCQPCWVAMTQGFAFRLPWRVRVRWHSRRVREWSRRMRGKETSSASQGARP